MKPLGPARFAWVAGAVALAIGALTVLAAGGYGPVALRYSLFGWFVTALTGVAGGAWLVARHGMQGTPFLVALVTCMLSRLILGVAGAALAATRGTEAMIAYVACLAAVYLPVQVVEIVWFQRRSALEQQAGEWQR